MQKVGKPRNCVWTESGAIVSQCGSAEPSDPAL